MSKKITHFDNSKYLNPNIVNQLKDGKQFDLFKTIEALNGDFSIEEIIPTLLNMIEDDIEQKDIIYYLDLINHYLSQLYGDKRYYYIDLTKNKLFQKLKILKKGDFRSILYQFLIDYSTLYSFDLSELKKVFPIDKRMLLKKIVEIAVKKGYLKFFLSYELAVFLTREEINSLWETIKTLDQNEQILIFFIFHSYLDEKNRKELFKIVLKYGEDVYKKFLPYFKQFYPQKELYLRNLYQSSLDLIDIDSKLKSGFLHRVNLLFFSEDNKIMLVSDFFEYTRYSFVVEFDIDFNHKNSIIFRQPTLFSKKSYFKHLKLTYPEKHQIPFDSALKFFKALFDKLEITKLPPAFILMHHFIFKGNLKGEKYQFNKIIKTEDSVKNRPLIFLNMIKVGVVSFFNYDQFISEDIHKLSRGDKWNYFGGGDFNEKFDNYINKNRELIFKKIEFLNELVLIKNLNSSIKTFFSILYYGIKEGDKEYLKNIPYLKEFLVEYCSQNKN